MTTSTSGKATSPATQQVESAFTRFFVAPMLLVSFLISLLLVDQKAVSSVFSKPHYIDTYSRQRKAVREEVDDAFHLRNRVLGVVLFVGGLSAALIGWACTKAFSAVFPSVSGP